ncbi:MAG: DUF4358 domain-containing protein [Candidatus Scatomorpha sp.]|jgi:hypothetical protein
MKRILIFLMAALLLFGVSACGKKEVKDPGMEAIDGAIMKLMTSDGSQTVELDADYVSTIVKISSDEYVEMNCRKAAASLSMDEWGIFKAKDEAARKNLETKLDAYLKARIESWMPEYLPDQRPKIEKSELYVAGNYVIYMILSEEHKDAVKAELDPLFK